MSLCADAIATIVEGALASYAGSPTPELTAALRALAEASANAAEQGVDKSSFLLAAHDVLADAFAAVDDDSGGDWVVFYGDTRALRCRRCKASERVALPMELNAFVQRMRAWGRRHSRCPLPQDAVPEMP